MQGLRSPRLCVFCLCKHVTGFSMLQYPLEAERRQTMRLINNNLSVVDDQIVYLTLAVEALNHGNVYFYCCPAAANAYPVIHHNALIGNAI